MTLLRHFIVASFLASLSIFAQATPEPYPQDRVALVLHLRNGDSRTFTLQQLQRLPQSSISQRGPQGTEQRWTGVSLGTLLDHAFGGRLGRTLRVEALNQYSVVIPTEDIQRYQPLVAYLQDGQFMSIRDYGPLQLLYPFDDHPELHQQAFYNRAVWQLSEIHVE